MDPEKSLVNNNYFDLITPKSVDLSNQNLV